MNEHEQEQEVEMPNALAAEAERIAIAAGIRSVYILSTLYGIFMFRSIESAKAAVQHGLKEIGKLADYQQLNTTLLEYYVEDNSFKYIRTGDIK